MRQRRAVAVFDEQNQFARADQVFQRHGKVFGRGLAFDGNAINHALPNHLLANGILGNLRNGDGHLSRKERFGGFNLQTGDVQIGRAEIQCQPRFAGVFVALGNGHRNGFHRCRFARGGVDQRAGKRNRLRTLVVHRQPQPWCNDRRK